MLLRRPPANCENAASGMALADRVLKTYRRTVAYLLVMSAFASVSPAIAFGPGDAPQLSKVRAIELMRAALISHYPVSWRKARGHNLGCPIAFHAEHGGKTQDEEIRRRCRFAWKADRIEFHGRGMVWLGGISSVGRDWHFQARVFQEQNGHIEVDHLGGTITRIARGRPQARRGG